MTARPEPEKTRTGAETVLERPETRDYRYDVLDSPVFRGKLLKLVNSLAGGSLGARFALLLREPVDDLPFPRAILSSM
jgi:hypothetical protein